MAKVYFAPNHAIKYVGTKAKVFDTSLARPKPKLIKGDIIIVDKRTAFNLTHKGFGEFVSVESIEFVKSDAKNVDIVKSLEEKLSASQNENNILFSKNVELTKKITQLSEQ